MKRTSFFIRLLLADGIGPATVLRIIHVLEKEQAWHDAVTWGAAVYAKKCGISLTLSKKIVTALSDDAAFEAHQAWLVAENVSVITLCDDAYPSLLKEIAVPPPVLWVKGDISVLSLPSCALVGARKSTVYAHRVVSYLIPALVQQKIITVSGGARGVDCAVHEETMQAHGKTIAVMGCGLAHTYPSEHVALFKQIVSTGGALLSPFPPFMAPSKGLFVMRNRVIAGLAATCVVIQASARSGALITASYALQENREVCTVPGPIDENAFEGSNKLLAEGAHPVIDAASLLVVCGVVGDIKDVESPEALTDSVSMLLLFLREPRSFDELCELWHADETSLHEVLYELSCSGKIQQNYAGYWERL